MWTEEIFSEKSEKEVSGNKNVHGEEGKNTNCQSCYKFKLSACKEAAAGREGPLKQLTVNACVSV